MQLNEYLKQKQLSPSQFAKQFGLKQPTVWRVINKKFRPRPDTASLISTATGGAVTVMELLFPGDKGQGA